MTVPSPNADCLLQVRQLSKFFPGVTALDGVQLDVARGEVHAVMGENGAGKSTLMKILIGIHTADAGEILFRGHPLRLRSPHAARQLGLAMIHQELLPFPDLTVAENLGMGREPTRWFPGWVDRAALHREATRWLEQLGASLPPTRKMRHLTVAELQTVEIAKSLSQAAELVIMDEPTSAISEREVERLFAIIRDLRRRGVAVIYVSHKMDEIFRIADRVTVLRDGRTVGSYGIGELDQPRLIRLMVGRELRMPQFGAPTAPGPVALEARGLACADKFCDISFQVRRGEIVGLAGLMGAGRTELVSTLFGLTPATAGEILISGHRVRIARPQAAISHGLALVSEDRKKFGLIPEMSVKHNISLASLSRWCHAGLIDHRRENQVADEQIRELAIKTPDRNRPVKYLSGGNQQKVVLAKSLLTDPDILLLDEPTRGIDIGAKAEIYALMRQLAAAGKALLLVSSELPEILALSDRLLVMREGRLTAELNPRSTTQEEVLKYALPH